VGSSNRRSEGLGEGKGKRWLGLSGSEVNVQANERACVWR
jgi:hypothetical protein